MLFTKFALNSRFACCKKICHSRNPKLTVRPDLNSDPKEMVSDAQRCTHPCTGRNEQENFLSEIFLNKNHMTCEHLFKVLSDCPFKAGGVAMGCNVLKTSNVLIRDRIVKKTFLSSIWVCVKWTTARQGCGSGQFSAGSRSEK